jgi:hypothetical protein
MKNLFYLLPLLFTPFFFVDAEDVYNEDTKAYEFPPAVIKIVNKN